MKIEKVICAPGRTGFYFDDQKAIKAGAPDEGNFYLGEAVTEGFSSIRQPGESGTDVCPRRASTSAGVSASRPGQKGQEARGPAAQAGRPFR